MKQSWSKILVMAICLGLFVALAVGSSPEEAEEMVEEIVESVEQGLAEMEEAADTYHLGYHARRTDSPAEFGGGQVSAEPYVADGTYTAGSTVTVIQQADQDFEFSHWEVWKEQDGKMEMVESSTQYSLDITMDADTSVDAFFEPKG